MDERGARESIAPLLGSAPRSLNVIPGGWDFDTFEVDGEWIFRFPKREPDGRSLERELRLLPALVDRLPFDVPRPVHRGTHDGRPFAGYRKISGRPLCPDDAQSDVIRRDLAGFLEAMHRFPADRARDLLGVEGTLDAWHEEYVRLRALFEDSVAPLVPAAVADAARHGFDRFAGSEFVPVLVHRDLGAEHILVHQDRLSGVIDFGDAGVGDPAIDLVGLWITLGPPAATAVAEACGYASEDFFQRVRFYHWMGAVHAVLYGLRIGDTSEVRAGCVGLASRLPG